MNYKEFSSEMFFTQLTVASEVRQEAGGFPIRLLNLQCELKLFWGFSLVCAVLAWKLGLGPLASLMKASLILPFRTF